jgi:ABC-type nitrate/sulfonate/bicarbonate transport system substrate-binding protein
MPRLRQCLKPAIALLFAIGAATSAVPAAAQEKGTVRLGHNRGWNNIALILGISQGHFKQAGVTVIEKSFNNPADIVQAIATGDLDAGVSPSGVLFTAVQRGVKVKGVAVVQAGQNPPVTFMVRTDSGINSVADLKGKNVAIGGFGGTSDLTLRYWASRAGLDPKTDFKTSFVPFQLMLPSLVNKQIDAAPLDAMLSIKVKQQYPGQLKALFSYEDVTKVAIGNHHVNGLLLDFGTAFIERDRDTAVRFLEGYLRAIRSVQADPKRALNEWSQASNDETIKQLDSTPHLPADGKIYLDALQFEAEMAHKFGYIKQPMDLKLGIDHSLIEEAARRIK